jgi:hypothetical protein
MSDLNFMNVTLPLFAEDTSLKQVLNRIGAMSSPAVVSTDGQLYQLIYCEDIAQALNEGSATKIGDTFARGIRLPSPQALGSPLDVSGIMSRPAGQRIGVAAVTSDFDGNRFVVAFGKAEDFWQGVVANVYECPSDLKEFPGPGMCGVHDVALRRKS